MVSRREEDRGISEVQLFGENSGTAAEERQRAASSTQAQCELPYNRLFSRRLVKALKGNRSSLKDLNLIS